MLIDDALKFARLSLREQLLLSEALLLLGLARLGIRLVPFRWLARLLGRVRAESPTELTAAQVAQAKQIRWAVGAMSRHTLWDSTCLAQAIAAQLMLRRRGVPSTLYLGMAKNGPRQLSAHAWVRSGRAILTGAPGHRQFTVVSTFATE